MTAASSATKGPPGSKHGPVSPKKRGVFSGPSVSEDVDREIRAHLALRAQELIDRGWDASAAEDEALRLFGDRATVARACTQITMSHDRAVGRAKMLENVWQDIRYGVRTLLKSPGFAFVAVLTLALGIGANTAIFSVVNGVLLQPLPFDRPGEIVYIRETTNRGGTMNVAWPNFRDWRLQSSSFQSLAAYGASSTTVLGGEEPVQARIAYVTEDFWSVFGVTPLNGRLTVAEDHLANAEAVMVVSRGFWQNELAGRDLSDVSLEVQGMRARVIGVVDNDFSYPGEADAWRAVQLGQSDSRTAHNWRVVARLAEGVSLEQASLELDALTRVLVQDAAGEDPDFLAVGAVVVPLQEQVVGGARAPLFLLLGAAGLVLLVACTNLASTLLARGTTRSRELAVRMSLGAAKARIIRQLLTESLVIAAIGGVAGVGMASVVMRALRVFGRESVPRLNEVSIDGWVLAYSATIALVTAFLFGLIPALRLTAQEAGDALRAGSRGNAVEGRGGIWRILVGTEVALALILLVGSGLLVRSFQTLLNEETGVDATDVTTAAISLSLVKYASEYDHARYYDELSAGLNALPGVSAAGVISSLPVSGSLPNGRLEIDGDVEKRAVAGYVVASGGAFEALDIPLLQGRLFDRRDNQDAEHVAIVSRAFAEQMWPNEEAIGRQVNGGGMDNFYLARTFARVIGVVGDVQFRSLDATTGPVVYFPHSQRPFRLQRGASVVVESAQGDAARLTSAVRATLQRLDSDVPIRIRTQESVVMDSVASRRFVMMLLGAFSVIALILAAVGIYGVVSYSVARRKREMGIRLALGADAGSVRSMVVKASMQMVFGGLVFGVSAAYGLTRVMSGLLYEVSPTDPVTMALVVAILAGMGFLASWLPARSGTRVDPMVTMRME